MAWTLAQIKANITALITNAVRTNKIDKDDLATVLNQNAEFVDERANTAIANTVVTANPTARRIPARSTSGVGYVDTGLELAPEFDNVIARKTLRWPAVSGFNGGSPVWFLLGRVSFVQTSNPPGGTCVVNIRGGRGFGKASEIDISEAVVVIRAGNGDATTSANVSCLFYNHGAAMLLNVKLAPADNSNNSLAWQWDVYARIDSFFDRSLVQVQMDEYTTFNPKVLQRTHADQSGVADPTASNVVTATQKFEVGSLMLVRDTNLIIGAWADTNTGERLQVNGTSRFKDAQLLENLSAHPSAPASGVLMYSLGSQLYARRAGSGSAQQLTT